MVNILTKSNLKSWGKVFLLLGFVVLMFSKGFHKTPKVAPDLTLTTITGKQIKLSALQGKPVIVNFWATSCPSCLEELPSLIALHDRYHSQGLEMIAVAMIYDPPNHVVNLTKSRNLPYDVVLDVNGEIAKAFGGIWAIPTTFLITPDRKIDVREVGLFDVATMEKRLQQLIKG